MLVSIHKLIWQMFRVFDCVNLATVAIPAHDVVRAGLGRDMADDTFYNILLHFFDVLWFVFVLATCWSVLISLQKAVVSL